MENITQHETLSEFDKTQIATNEKIERAKELITPILMTTPDEWIVESLFELMEIFTVKQTQIFTEDVAEAVQKFLFGWTGKHHRAYSEYRENLFGEETETAPLDLSNSSIEDLSLKLSDILHNPNLPVKIYECITDQLNEISVDTDSPENILHNLKKLNEVKNG